MLLNTIKSKKEDLKIIESWFENDNKSFFYWTGFDFNFIELNSEMNSILINPDVISYSVFNESKIIAYYEIHKYQESSNWYRLVRFVIDPLERNKGYGTSIIKNLAENYKNKANTRLDLIVFNSNKKACKVYLNNGFELEGIMRKAGFYDGKYLDISLMSVIGIYE